MVCGICGVSAQTDIMILTRFTGCALFTSQVSTDQRDAAGLVRCIEVLKCTESQRLPRYKRLVI